MKDINYFTVQGWMVSKLKLKGNNLMVYSIIYGFSQDGESEFTGSIKYLCTWLSASRPTIIKALKELTALGYIIKRQKVVNHVYFNRYKVDLQVVKKLYRGSKETLQGGSKETLPNSNSLDNKLDNNKKTKTKKDLEIKQPLKRTKTLINYFPKDWIDNKNFQTSIKEFITHRKTIKKELTQLACTKIANKWTQFTIKEVCEAIDTAIMNNYTGVFPKKEYTNNNQKGKGLGTHEWTDDRIDYSGVKVHKYDPTKQ